MKGATARTIEIAFAQLGLASPPVPSRWAATLKERRPWLFCTAEPPRFPLDWTDCLPDETGPGWCEEGLLIGFLPDRKRERSLCYSLIEQDLVMLLQFNCGRLIPAPNRPVNSLVSSFRSRWDTFLLFLDRRRVRERVANAKNLNKSFATLGGVLGQMKVSRETGARLPGRLAVVDTQGSSRYWGWMPPKTADHYAATGQRCSGDAIQRTDWACFFDEDVLAAALAELKNL